ncbi:Hypothetical predicted protein [Paramuricea clavata]|uniref:Uncharacterized protein n=1 Tax=Paramuricea clavata TaxID=317549 RepID=A0A7D9IHP3_PARCT|nr:Hypothetical predicted protein [Paramuricea clavata]
MFKLSSLEEKFGAIKHRLQERYNELYDCNHVPKQWAGNTQKVSTQKLGSIQLLPRFHIKASEYLIAQGTVDDMEEAKEAKRLLDILLERRAAAKKATTVKSQEERTSLESESELSDRSEVDDEITEPGDDESDSFEMDEDSDY